MSKTGAKKSGSKTASKPAAKSAAKKSAPKAEAFSAGENAPIASQYEKWVYPFPIMDLNDPEHRARKDGGDFATNFYTYWPDREKREDLDVLIAGCGSNAAARYAFNHPQARVTGLDLSASSLAHEQYLKDKHSLENLTLHQGRIEDVVKLGKKFDFIDCSGVLHHLPDPVSGLKALASVLKPEGTMAIMVYATYGRTGVYMMQDLFRLMNLGQTEQDVAHVKEAIGQLPRRHPIHDYMSRTRDTKYDAGLVDTFLHRQDRAYTVAECLDFAEQAGVSFMGWWDNIFYYPEGQLNLQHPFFGKINALPDTDKWKAMEVYNGTIAQHGFCVCLPSRDKKTYRVDFDAADFMNYIPVLRSQQVAAPAGVKLAPGSITIRRASYPAYTLGPAAAALYRQIDGKKTVAECFKAAGLTAADGTPADVFCRQVLRHLWRLSYIFLRLPPRR